MSQVLLLDDDASQLRIREAILRSAGLLVSIATTPESALAIMRTKASGHFSVVVTDHLLVGQTGADFVRELRNSSPTMPVIVLSGLPDIDDEYSGLNVTIRQKPLPPEELIKMVKTAMQNVA